MISYKHTHTHLTSTDPRKAVEFYTQILGARVIGEITRSGKSMVDLDVGGLPVRISSTTGVEESQKKEQPPVVGKEAPRFGLHHFALLVGNLNETAADLKSKGVEFIVEPTEVRPGLRCAFIKAPDNVRIELIEKSESH